jgi:hypothetical protein
VRTRASISAEDPPVANFGSVITGRAETSAGKSHSWLRATSQWRRPSAATISVALSMSETIRLAGFSRVGIRDHVE